ncbi:hypothetical protein PsorP6_016137 [Peronosclerospora sorghi]|uniref:Uncharacterized protein n=1 Tax=Peronosclerospora sorghi TaxID=230839 RepID=A0ACC0VLZ5_9STRA|nr:hypothetical protein PsorP6_016137 [Peronosclerospora sorghi]
MRHSSGGGPPPFIMASNASSRSYGTGDCNKLKRDSSSDYVFKFLVLTQVFMYLEAGAVPSLLQEFTHTFSLRPQDQGL